MSCFVLPFLVVWACGFISQMQFYWSIAPATLSKWAEENGYRIEQQRAPILFEGPYAWNAGGIVRVYRIAVRDRDWHLKHAWVRLGRSWWPCLSVEECPVTVEWDRQTVTPTTNKDLWDPDLDV